MSAENTDHTAVPHASPVNNATDHKRGKQGHSFLFCLCDMRRAVIILNVFCLISSILGGIAVILLDKYGHNIEGFEIDNGEEETYALDVLVAFQAIGACMSMIAILGAVQFSICPVVTAALWNIAYIVICALDKQWIAVGWHVVVLYPHLVLPYDLAKGVMTRENYRQFERQSCCCC